MARIRTIKPEFWTDGNIVSLSPLARLFFIGMWNFTLCDHGHVADDVFRLKLQILPADTVDPDALLQEIINAGRVQRISDSNGRSYLFIKRFADHQKIDPRWRTRCPACAQVDSLLPVETQPSLIERERETPVLTPGKYGKGREARKTSSNPAGFEGFWAAYPRKVGKQAAVSAFAKALKNADAATITAGAAHFRTQVDGKDRQFIPYPAHWLNDGRWEDETDEGQPEVLPAGWRTLAFDDEEAASA